MYLDLETIAPGPLLYNNDDLINAIKNIEKIENDYEEKANKFYKQFCYLEDGGATNRVINTFF